MFGFISNKRTLLTIAKVNLNYESLNSGSQAESARFLTGAPAKDFETNLLTLDELWY